MLSFNRKVIEELIELHREVNPGVEPLDIDWERLNQIEFAQYDLVQENLVNPIW